MYLISQYGKNDCAFTCLCMMLANYQKDKNYLFLKHEDRAYNFKELINIAKEYNIELLGVKITESSELLKNKTWPIIVTLKGERNTNHAVLLIKVNRKYAFYYDPCLGKRKILFSEFVNKWTKLALICSNLTNTKCNKKISIAPKRKDINLLLFFQITSGIGILLGVFFLDKKYPLYISLICFAIFAIFEIIFRRYLIFALNHIDEEIYQMKIVKPNEGYGIVFETIQKYRYNALTTLPKIFCGLMISIFVIIILALNNFWNLSFVIAALALSLIECLVIKPIINEKKNEIAEEESKILMAENDYQFHFFCKKANTKANKVGLFKVAFNYVEIIILLIFSYLMMKLTGVENVTFVIFNLGISYFLISTFNTILNYATERDEFDYIKLKLNNYLESNDANKVYM